MQVFSERIGKKTVEVNIQREDADNKLRSGIWNCIYIFYLKNAFLNVKNNNDPVSRLLESICLHFYNLNYDEIFASHPIKERIKKDILFSKWYEMYDLVEFIIRNYGCNCGDDIYFKNYNKECSETINDTLEINLSAYRIVGFKIVEITSEQEIKAIEEALLFVDEFQPVNDHFTSALILLSDRINPNYRNSIKESISAIESFCRIFTKDKKSTLTGLLGQLENQFQLHKALKSSFSSLYGYTSDASGIRHSLMEESTVGQEDAKLMLVMCTSFVNYLRVILYR